jgi:hypothetical protein
MFITHMQSLFGWSNACYDMIYTPNTIPVRLVIINSYENSLTGLSQAGNKIVLTEEKLEKIHFRLETSPR